MKLLSHVGLLFMLLFVSFSNTSCRHTPPTLTDPHAIVAYQLEDAVDAINLFQHEVIVLNRAHKVSPETTRRVGRYRRHAADVIDKAIDAGTGKEAAIQDVSNGLVEVEKALLGKPEKDVLRTAIEAVRVVLVALGGH